MPKQTLPGSTETIEIDDREYVRLSCGCNISRMVTYYCGHLHTPTHPPPEEAQIIRHIELTVASRGRK